MATITIKQNINQNMLDSSTSVPIFINDTKNTIVLSTWGYCDFGMVMYKRKYINPGDKQTLDYSTTNEFIIDSECYERIGKFRLKAREGRDIHWMVSDDHDIISYTLPSNVHPCEFKLVTTQ